MLYNRHADLASLCRWMPEHRLCWLPKVALFTVTAISKIRLQLIVSFLFVFITSAAASAAASTVILGYNGCADALHLLMLLFDFFSICFGVRIQPRLTILEGVHNLFLLIIIHLLTQAFVFTRSFRGGAHGVNVAIESVLGINS